jgi:hypothetical protein
LTKSQNPERKTWIGIHTEIVGVGGVTFTWLPQWSGSIMAAAFVLLVFTPNSPGIRDQTREHLARLMQLDSHGGDDAEA